MGILKMFLFSISFQSISFVRTFKPRWYSPSSHVVRMMVLTQGFSQFVITTKVPISNCYYSLDAGRVGSLIIIDNIIDVL